MVELEGIRTLHVTTPFLHRMIPYRYVYIAILINGKTPLRFMLLCSALVFLNSAVILCVECIVTCIMHYFCPPVVASECVSSIEIRKHVGKSKKSVYITAWSTQHHAMEKL